LKSAGSILNYPDLIPRHYPNCPNAKGTCPNIHVGEDIPEGEVEAVVASQLGEGAPPRPPQNRPENIEMTTNGHAPKRHNQSVPKAQSQKPQEQVPLCKFGTMCTKPDCPFAHPTPAAGQDGLVLRGEMCPDGRECLNPEVLPL
jgi:nuclear polyadenylated RNA-binding protein NAB2